MDKACKQMDNRKAFQRGAKDISKEQRKRKKQDSSGITQLNSNYRPDRQYH